MLPSFSRRAFLHASAGLVATGLFAGLASAQDNPPAPNGRPKPPPKPPVLTPEKVSAVVGAAHRSLEKVRELVEATPLLVNACWDQGGGDFETPLEAAAHTGQREIAEYLLGKGARPSLYAAGMLGQLELVKGFLAIDPNAHLVPGPHGFTLLHCAKQGDEPARAVYDYLRSIGVPEVFQRPLPYVWPEGTKPTA